MKIRVFLSIIVLIFALPAFAQFHARVKVQAYDEAAENRELKLRISHELEAIDGVISVEKEPDYLLVAWSTKSQTTGEFAIRIDMEEILESRISKRLFIRTDYRNELEDANWIAQLLRRTDHSDLRITNAETMQQTIRDIVRDINTSTFERQRRYPRGESTLDNAFKNFMLRSGSKVVQ